MDLVRDILLRLESKEDYTTSDFLQFDDWSDQQVSYHIKLMHEAGLVHAHAAGARQGSVSYSATSLTWSGHEFLEAVRPPTVWKRTKEIVGAVGTASLEVIKTVGIEVAIKLARQHI